MGRELGCDETGEAFKRAFAKIALPKKPGGVAGAKVKVEAKKAR